MAELKFDKLDHTGNAYIMQLDDAISSTERLLEKLKVSRLAAKEAMQFTSDVKPTFIKPTRDPLAAAKAVDSSDKA